MFINSGGWQADLINDFEAGIVTYGLSFSHIANKIHSILNNKEWKERASRNSLKLAKKHFAKNMLVKDFEKILIEASNRNGKDAHKYGY